MKFKHRWVQERIIIIKGQSIACEKIGSGRVRDKERRINKNNFGQETIQSFKGNVPELETLDTKEEKKEIPSYCPKKNCMSMP